MFTNRKPNEHLQKGDALIDALEKELARAQGASRLAKRQNEQSKEALSRIASTSLSFVEVIDDLGITLQEAVTAAAIRLINRRKDRD